MTRPWLAERAVSLDLARSLIEGAFPELAPARLEPLHAAVMILAYGRDVGDQALLRECAASLRYLAAAGRDAE